MCYRAALGGVTVLILAAGQVRAATENAGPLVSLEEEADCLIFETRWYRAELDRATGLLRRVVPRWASSDSVAMTACQVEDARGGRHSPSRPKIGFPHRSPFYCMVSCRTSSALGKHTRVYEFLDSPAIYVTEYMRLQARTALKGMRAGFTVRNGIAASADGVKESAALNGTGTELFAEPLYWEGEQRRCVWRALHSDKTTFSFASFPEVSEFPSFDHLGRPRMVVRDGKPPKLEVRIVLDPERQMEGTVAVSYLLCVERKGREHYLRGVPASPLGWPGKLLRMFWAHKGYDSTVHYDVPQMRTYGFNWHTYCARINDVVADYQKDKSLTLYHDLITRHTYNRLEFLAAGGGIYFPPVADRGREHFPSSLNTIGFTIREYRQRYPEEAGRLYRLVSGTIGFYRVDPTYNLTGKATADTILQEVRPGIWLAKANDIAPKISPPAWNYHCIRTNWAKEMMELARLVGDDEAYQGWRAIWTNMVNGFLYYLPAMVTERRPKYVHVLDGAFACGDHTERSHTLAHPLPPYWDGDLVYDPQTNRVYKHYAYILKEFIEDLANRHAVQVAVIPLIDKVMRNYRPPRTLRAPESAWKGIPPVRGRRENAPTVRLLFPKGGETVSGTAMVKWEARDPRNKPLRYRIAYSADGGQTWTHLAIGWKKTEYAWRTNWDFGPYSKHLRGIPDGDNYLLRVEADNGEATAVAVSGAPFAVDNPTVQIIEPAQGATVKGKVTIRWKSDGAARRLDYTLALFHPTFLAAKIDKVLFGGKGTYQAQWDTTTVPDGTYYLMLAAGHGEINENLDFRIVCPPFEDNRLILASDYLELRVEN